MVDPTPRRYFDSDSIIHFIQGHPDYAPGIERLFEHARAGRWLVVVSAITLVEVTRAPNQPVELARFAKIHSFFESPFIYIREIDVLLAMQARDLIYNHSWLYPIDAVHFAAAIATRCDTLYTYDVELIRKLDGEYGLRVLSPEELPGPTGGKLDSESYEPNTAPRPSTYSIISPAMITTRPDFSTRLRALAPSPGVYLMKDAKGGVIYVGKAIRLRDRVRSYFQSQRGLDPKTRELVAHVADFEVIRTDTATEALILENELIKRYQPKYNVMLKDSKTYPYLKITAEEWPRIVLTRQIVPDGGRYFGPYTSAGAAYRTLNLLNRLFPYRKCDKKITGHDELCLYYHLHQCTAPCISAVDRPTYMQAVDRAALFLNGQAEEIIDPLEEEMAQAADAWNFERAAELRDRITSVKHVIERQKVVSPNGTNADLIAVAQGAGGDAGVQVGFLRNGKILGSEFFPMRALVEDRPEEILSGFVGQFYAEAAVVPPILMLQHPLPEGELEVVADWLRQRRGGKVDVVVPRRGRKRELVEMVAKSAVENLEQSRLKFLSDEQKMTAAMTELGDALDLPRLPRRIECFDISNLQGTNPVASMVVFEDGRPLKKDYRRFAIKTVEGSNDFAMMKEVIRRRFRRAAETAEEGAGAGKWTTLPDLVIVDGGKGQLNAALEALAEVGATGQPIVGLAKENEELFLPARRDPVVLPRDAQALFLVQRVRDEAHRFAVSFHRQRRSKAAFHSSLDDVPGIGPRRKQALIRHFGTLKAVKEASEQDLTTVAGITPALAAQIKASL